MSEDAAMIGMGINEIAQAVSGTVVPVYGTGADPNVVVTSVADDSRQVLPGCAFVAIAGERVDGHAFVAAAAKSGAVVALVEHEVPDAPIPQIVVDNSVQALGALARHNIDRRRELGTDFSVIGITGSVGKTTTKDLLHALLSDLGPTVAPVGSFNNNIGLPLTALQVNEHTRFLIAEMGANHVGEIANLTTIAPPDVAVVLKVGTAHLGEFGSVELIARAKSEIVRGLLPDGIAVLNADDAHVADMAALAPGRVIWFGEHAEDGNEGESRVGLNADAIGEDAADRPTFKMREYAAQEGGRGKESEVTLAISGGHNVYNALAAASVAHHYGMTLDRIAAVLRTVRVISPHRMAISRVDVAGTGFTLIDDSFNANPDSMKAGLDALAAWRGDGVREHPRVAVLGAMLELGPEEMALHRTVGAYAVNSGVEAVIAVGSDADGHLDALAHALAQGADERARASAPDASCSVQWVHTVDEAERSVDAFVAGRPRSVVLVKGSHASGLGSLIERWSARTGETAV